jgi:serine/threonine protein kinase
VTALKENSRATRFPEIENENQTTFPSSHPNQGLRNVLRECLEPDPLRRPQWKRLLQILKLHLPTGNLISSFLNRLSKYSEDLENVIASRTRELLDEAKKVDDLLSQVIPR